MGQQGAKKKEITISDAFGDVTVKANGVSVEIHTDGSVLAYTTADVKKISTIANDDGNPSAPAELKVGYKMLDGTVFAGISPDTNKPMYTTPADASLTMTFNEATEYAAKLDAPGHRDWRVPTKAELNVLFNNRAAIGGFNVTGSYPSGWYWSSPQDGGGAAWGQRFSDGDQDKLNKLHHSAVRCVR
jgi:hypothetical protein